MSYFFDSTNKERGGDAPFVDDGKEYEHENVSEDGNTEKIINLSFADDSCI